MQNPLFPNPAPTASPSAYALTGATLWDGTGAAPVPDSVLLVESGRIKAAGRAATTSIPPETPHIDVRGKWVMPGLIDLHVHLDEVLEPKGSFVLFGVTTVRDVGSRQVTLERWRAASARGSIVPRLFWMGRNIDENKPSWSGAVAVPGPAQVPALLTDMQRQGVDGVKLYIRARPDVARAVITDAHRRGLPVTGHLEDTPPTIAAKLGIDNLEHVFTLFGELAPKPAQTGFRAGFYRAAHADLRSSATRRLIDTLASRRVAITATLAVSFFPVAGEAAAREAYDGWAEAVPSGWRTYWKSPYWGFVRPDGWTRADFDTARRAQDKLRALTSLLHGAGVPLVAGTDTPAPWVLPGAGLVREIELLTQSGVPARDALLAATGSAAKVLCRVGEVGSLVPGARADFLVLASSPLAEVRVLRRPDAVYLGGSLVNRAGLRRVFTSTPAPPPSGLAL